MYYKFDVNGIYCGISEEKIPYSTDIAPPDENTTAKWVWNHYSWIGMPTDWEPIKAQYVEPTVVTPVAPAETPTEPTA